MEVVLNVVPLSVRFRSKIYTKQLIDTNVFKLYNFISL